MIQASTSTWDANDSLEHVGLTGRERIDRRYQSLTSNTTRTGVVTAAVGVISKTAEGPTGSTPRYCGARP